MASILRIASIAAQPAAPVHGLHFKIGHYKPLTMTYTVAPSLAFQALEAMHASTDGIIILAAVRDDYGTITDFRIVAANPCAARLMRTSLADTVGLHLRRDLAPTVSESHFQSYVQVFLSGHPISEELRVDHRFVDASWLAHHAVRITDGIAITLRDISLQKRETRNLQRTSVRDDLTGLYNRRGFLTCAEQQLRIARRQGKDALVMYIDMNGFKQINDNFGHSVGDRALIAVGHLLRKTVRECDVVARIGGDEFTILALDANSHGARAIQYRIERGLITINTEGTFPVPLSLTTGFTRVRPSDTAELTELLARADSLLCHRKRRRRLLMDHTSGHIGGSTTRQDIRELSRPRSHHECVVSASCSSSPISSNLRHHGR